jgi:hypothetical protein
VPDLLDDLRRYGEAVETAALDRDRPAYVSEDEPEMLPAGRSPSRRMVLVGVAAVALLALIVSLTVLLTDDDHDSVRIDTPPSSAVTSTTTTVPPVVEPAVDATVLPASDATWTPIDPGPLAPRFAQSTVWTGAEMIVWGGADSGEATTTGGPVLDDGAAYDPTTGKWRMLPPSPLGARAIPIGVWTGSEMIVWAGGASDSAYPARSDGAAYDPQANPWRLIEESPLPDGLMYSGAWTGSEMVAVAASDDGLVAGGYNPRSDTWRLIDTDGARIPLESIDFLVVHWTGSRVVVVPRLPLGAPLMVAILDPASDSWSVQQPLGFGARSLSGAVLDGALHLVSYVASSDGTVSLDPSLEWGRNVRLPGLDCEGGPSVTALASTLFVRDECGRAAIYDPALATLQPAPDPISFAEGAIEELTSLVWTGDQLIGWGVSSKGLSGSPSGARSIAWSLTP